MLSLMDSSNTLMFSSEHDEHDDGILDGKIHLGVLFPQMDAMMEPSSSSATSQEQQQSKTTKKAATQTIPASDGSNSFTTKHPTKWDVLSGRGKTIFNHPGNQRFRILVGDQLDAYLQAKSRMEKTCIVVSIIQAVRERDGRFLKKRTSGGSSDHTHYYDIGDRQAREKVGHALRDAHAERLRSGHENSYVQQSSSSGTSAKASSSSSKRGKRRSTKGGRSRRKPGRQKQRVKPTSVYKTTASNVLSSTTTARRSPRTTKARKQTIVDYEDYEEDEEEYQPKKDAPPRASVPYEKVSSVNEEGEEDFQFLDELSLFSFEDDDDNDDDDDEQLSDESSPGDHGISDELLLDEPLSYRGHVDRRGIVDEQPAAAWSHEIGGNTTSTMRRGNNNDEQGSSPSLPTWPMTDDFRTAGKNTDSSLSDGKKKKKGKPSSATAQFIWDEDEGLAVAV